MLWYRFWLETRWRFASGLALLLFSAIGVVLAHREMTGLLPVLPQNVDPDSDLARRILETATLAREYRGYVWTQWFRQNMANLWVLWAVILGAVGLLSQRSGGAAVFTLALPVSRRQLLGVRAATGLAQLLALAVIPSVAISLISPAVGQSYSAIAAVVHSVCFFLAGSVFFSLAFLLSTIWTDVWRPVLITLCVALVLGWCEQVSDAVARYGIFRVMSGEEYFRNGAVPWVGLAITAGLSAAMVYGAFVNIERKDF
jgi:hypothetical protein